MIVAKLNMSRATPILFIFLLAGCASVKSRYRQQKNLVIHSANCERMTLCQFDGKGMCLSHPLDESIQGRNLFDLIGLSDDEALEAYCGDFCEPPGVQVEYRVGSRTSADELFLTSFNGDRSMRLNFLNKSYQLVLFYDSSALAIETGMCKFTPVQ